MLNRVGSGSRGPIDPNFSKVDKVSIGRGEGLKAGEAEAAQETVGVEGELRQAVGEIAQSLGRAADKFTQVTMNPYSQQARMSLDNVIQNKIRPALDELGQALQQWGGAAAGEALGKALDENIKNWGDHIHELAAKGKEDHLKSEILNADLEASAKSTNHLNDMDLG